MNAQQAKMVADFLIADFEREMDTTMRVMSAVPTDRMDYRPDTKSRTGLGLVRHIALEDEWMLNAVADGIFAAFPDQSDACGLMHAAEAVAYYKKAIPPALARVRALSGDDLLKTADLHGMMQAPRINFLCSALKHSVHHRGQLSSYLRAMGGTVPSIYGPTADMQVGVA
ncbi:MAG TPA: DinB family protein [Vicinamibacterales bacterium]|jgi:uncharacterized damage-inducible protein DinB